MNSLCLSLENTGSVLRFTSFPSSPSGFPLGSQVCTCRWIHDPSVNVCVNVSMMACHLIPGLFRLTLSVPPIDTWSPATLTKIKNVFKKNEWEIVCDIKDTIDKIHITDMELLRNCVKGLILPDSQVHWILPSKVIGVNFVPFVVSSVFSIEVKWLTCEHDQLLVFPIACTTQFNEFLVLTLQLITSGKHKMI